MKEKVYIEVYKFGVFQGYIKSVSYKSRTYKISLTRETAKGYSTNDKVMYDIDFLTTPESIANGITFSIG